MIDNSDNNTITNFLKGKYSFNDYLKVKQWFSDIDNNIEMKDYVFSHWNKLTDSELPKTDELGHLYEKIQNILQDEEKKVAKRKNIWNFYRQAAAILIIPLLGFLFWTYYSISTNQLADKTHQNEQGWVEINAPIGARVEFFLPDSSMGWLNSGSKLKYPTTFQQHRIVELQGEAYFDVKHLSHSDFEVSVADMNIKVLGTKFNVSAFANDPFTDVVLAEGKVEINGKSAIFKQTLMPDEKIRFNRESKSLKLTKVIANRYTSWKDGYLVIENESLNEVAGRIERWYNVEFNIHNDVLKNYRFKATFRDEPIEEVLRLMAKTTPISYTIEDRITDSTGRLKQKKVNIKLNQ
jgi:ferric-dicitrate binding protein FerR (iron transport regulator)